MFRLRCAILVVGVALFAVAASSGQEKKADKDEPKAKGMLPANWKKIGLTDDQKDKIYKVQSRATRSKIDDLQKKIADLKAKEKDEMVKLLTDEQKKRLQDILLGETKDKAVKDK